MNSSTSSAGPPSIRCRRKRNRTTNVNPGHGGGPLVCYSLGMDTEALRTAILDSLKEVHDPEIPVNIVDLGLVYEVRVEDDGAVEVEDRKSTRLNSSHVSISYAVFCLKKKKKQN